MLAATSRTTRLGVSFWNFMESPFCFVDVRRPIASGGATHTWLCVRNASIHAPCEGRAGRAASFSVAPPSGKGQRAGPARYEEEDSMRVKFWAQDEWGSESI